MAAVYSGLPMRCFGAYALKQPFGLAQQVLNLQI